MKSIFTFLAFILACSILLSSFEEAEGVGYILELTRPTRKSRSSSKNGKGKRNLKQSKKANRQLKRQMKKVMRSLRKTQQKEAILRRMLHTVSLYKRTFFKIGICTFMKKIKQLDCGNILIEGYLSNDFERMQLIQKGQTLEHQRTSVQSYSFMAFYEGLLR